MEKTLSISAKFPWQVFLGKISPKCRQLCKGVETWEVISEVAKNNIQFRLDIATPALETLNLFTKYITASRKGHTAERPCLPSYCLLQIIFFSTKNKSHQTKHKRASANHLEITRQKSKAFPLLSPLLSLYDFFLIVCRRFG